MTVLEKSKIVERACEIIFSNEGNYGSVNKDDNGAISIGKVQWHASRALALLQNIINVSNAAAQQILGDALYNEISSSSGSNWNSRTVSQDEADKISALLTTAQGRSAQDRLASNDVMTYVEKGISYGLENAEALIYFADGINQYGTYSSLWRNIATQALANGGTLDAMYSATQALTSSNMSRRTSVYNKLKETDTSATTGVSSDKINIVPSSTTIRQIQRWCNSYRNTGLVVDGQYGPKTKSALVKCLQSFINNEVNNSRVSSLDEDGIWGKMTRGACPYVSTSHNQNGNLAYIAQSALYVSGYDPKGIDGIFGPNSEKAAKKYQSDKRITVDGAVGPLTFDQMLG